MSRVLRSADDQLFLIGGTNDVLRLYDADGFASLVPVDKWRARLAEREALLLREQALDGVLDSLSASALLIRGVELALASFVRR